jgi:broad specificity phosphatase PhoE
MNIYFVRHGESEGNTNHIHQLPTTPLTSQGRQQAKELAKRLQKINFDQIVCSNFVRTKQTAQEIVDITSKPIEYSSLFCEIKRPKEIENLPINAPEAVKIKELMYRHWNDKDWHFSDEENFNDLIIRSKQALKYLESKGDTNILVISHGMFIRTIVGLILFENSFTPQLLIKSFRHWQTNNTGITWIEKKDSIWKLITWNDHAHLG